MIYPTHLLEEIKAKLLLSEIVRPRVPLKRQGREWVGLSPFTSEKTPSFYVNDQKKFYHDFSSGKHGDAFSFLMETEGLTFKEAVERLAPLAGVPLPKPSGALTPPQKDPRQHLLQSLESACQFFESALQKPEAALARQYLEKRKISPQSQKEFRLGYAPDSRNALKRHLLRPSSTFAASPQEVFSEEILIGAGLLIPPSSSQGQNTYDRFRNRLILPIQDSRGRVVGFGGRILTPDQQPKYLNSPETDIFYKSQILFNYHRAKASLPKISEEKRPLVVVEGYLDALALYQAGFPSVVATLGTSLSSDHIQNLWLLHPEPIICFDADRAGQNAAQRTIERFLPLLKSGYSCRFAQLPAGQDPDEYVHQNGLPAFTERLAQATPLWEMLWEREIAISNHDTPEDQALLEKKIFDYLNLIPDSRVQKYYRTHMKQQLRQFFWNKNQRAYRMVSKSSQAFSAGQSSNLSFSSSSMGESFRNPSFLSGRMLRAPKEPLKFLEQEILFLGLCLYCPEGVAQYFETIASMNLQGSTQHYTHAVVLQEILKRHYESVHLPHFSQPLRESEGDSQDRASTPPVSPPSALYFFCKEIYGLTEANQPSGSLFKGRFPLLKDTPPAAFLCRCMTHFMDMFTLRELEQEIRALMNEGSSPLRPGTSLSADLPRQEDDLAQQLLDKQAECLIVKDRIHTNENLLAEEAEAFRSSTTRNRQGVL